MFQSLDIVDLVTRILEPRDVLRLASTCQELLFNLRQIPSCRDRCRHYANLRSSALLLAKWPGWYADEYFGSRGYSIPNSLAEMTFAKSYHVTKLDSLVEMSFGRNPKLTSFLCPIVLTMGRTQIPFSNSRPKLISRTTKLTKIPQKLPSATRGSQPRSAVILIFHAESAAIAERVLSHYLRR